MGYRKGERHPFAPPYSTTYTSLQHRKHIVKQLKPHVERMCKDDEAQLVLFTALDVIE